MRKTEKSASCKTKKTSQTKITTRGNEEITPVGATPSSAQRGTFGLNFNPLKQAQVGEKQRALERGWQLQDHQPQLPQEGKKGCVCGGGEGGGACVRLL